MQFSLIIPVHGAGAGLPALLESVLAQTISRDMEVIVVDDCSPQGFSELVEAYVAQGLHIKLIRLPERVYTKNARLTGFEASTAEVVGFADADDRLFGTDTLACHVHMLREQQADVVHFASILINDDGTFLQENRWSRPFGDRLEGKDIFSAYLRKGTRSATMWSRMYSRRVLLAMLDEGRCSHVRLFREDLLLSTLIMFHARRYVGSDRIGYAYCRKPRNSEKAAGRAVSSYVMLRELVPYLSRSGCPPEDVEILEAKLRLFLQKRLRLFYERVYEQEDPCVSEATARELLRHGDVDTITGMLLSYFPAEEARRKYREHARLHSMVGRLCR